jgi:ABC-type transport system substrate-binding protein
VTNWENIIMTSKLSRRGFVAGALAAPFVPPISVSLAQTVKSGAELPPLLMESYPDQMTVEVARLYIRELEKLGIRVMHKPLAFSQILGKVYGSKDYFSAMMGFGFPEDRLDPDFYVRACLASNSTSNIPHYKNAEFDKYANAQLVAPSLEQRKRTFRRRRGSMRVTCRPGTCAHGMRSTR